MFNRWIYAYDRVSGDPSELERRFLEDIDTILARATDTAIGDPAGDGSFVLPISSTVAGIELAKHVRVRVGVAYRPDRRALLPVQWHAEPARHAFPTFEGTLELEPMDDRGSQLTLAGRYRPPMGAAGAMADSILFAPVAQRTAEQLMSRIATALQTREATEPVRSEPRTAEALRVADVMTPDPLVLDEVVPLRTAALLLHHAGISGAPVVSHTGELLGVLSERDLLAKEATYRASFGRRGRAEDRKRRARTVGQACSRPAKTTSADARLSDAARLMLDGDLSRLVVVDHGRIEGIVTLHDILAALVRDDVFIELAVRHVLEGAGEKQVHADVEWGEVHLSGVVSTLSAFSTLVEQVEAIDGVMHVETTDLTYRVDDLAPLARPL